MRPPLGCRIGIGYDNHRLVEGRPFMLGGTVIPSTVGEEAHSDGDVLIHALVDALLGAAGEGDIGTLFPDSDAKWKGQASRLFLEGAADLVRRKGYTMINADTIVVVENVRIGEHRQTIVDSLRSILAPWFKLEADCISLKAKTNERCDTVGEGRAVVAHAVVLLGVAPP